VIDYTQSPEWRALLASVAANPDDDIPRKAMADWLRDHGHDDRADFIQAQITAVRDPDEPVRAAAVKYYGTILHRMQASNDVWPDYRPIASVPPVDPYDCDFRVDWDRGFIVGVETDWPTWQQIGPQVVECQPITRVELGDFDCELLESVRRTVRYQWVEGPNPRVPYEMCLPRLLFANLPLTIGEPILPATVEYESIADGNFALSVAAIRWAGGRVAHSL
jgi:uncharacterized protein (TIGR02996 family)